MTQGPCVIMVPSCLAPLLLAAALFVAPSAHAAVWVVRPDGHGDFPTIQAAIDGARPGDVIELTDGTFTGSGNRDIAFGGKDVTVRSQNQDPSTCTINCQGSPSSPHRGFIFDAGEGAGSVLEAVTVKNGYAGGTWPAGCGGGVFCSGSSPTIRGCVFSGNGADIGGGGLQCTAGASPRVTRCDFEGNHSHSLGGGGMACCFPGGGNPYVDDCVFSGNSAGGGDGGGIFTANGSSPILVGCIFSSNANGAACFAYTSLVTVTDCIFRDNSGDSGGVLCYQSMVDFTGCTFDNNFFVALWICIPGSGGTIRNCTFYANRCAGPDGAAICCGDCVASFENTIVAGTVGGRAIVCSGASQVSFACCDLYGNEQGDWDGSACTSGHEGKNGNFAADPMFCDPSDRDYRVFDSSPCAPGHAPQCGLIGAWTLGCFAVPVEDLTWGRLKARYR